MDKIHVIGYAYRWKDTFGCTNYKLSMDTANELVKWCAFDHDDSMVGMIPVHRFPPKDWYSVPINTALGFAKITVDDTGILLDMNIFRSIYSEFLWQMSKDDIQNKMNIGMTVFGGTNNDSGCVEDYNICYILFTDDPAYHSYKPETVEYCV